MPSLRLDRPAPTRRCFSAITANDKIDICRGSFAFLVVAAHALEITWALHPQARTLYPTWLYRLLAHGFGWGLYWVMGFFVISGYCIQLSVSRSLAANSYSLGHYLAARLSRILPLYLLGLGVALVVEWLIASARPACWPNGLNAETFLAQIFLVQNLTETFGSYASSWSITNEMFCYLLYGVVVAIAVKSGRSTTVAGMLTCIVVTVPLNVFYFAVARSPYVLSLGLLFGYCAIWYLGALVAEGRDRLRTARWASAMSRWWWLLVAMAIGMWVSEQVHLQIVLLVLGPAFALMLVRFVVTERASPRDTERLEPPKFVEMLALASYPTYLFHGPLLMLIGSIILRFDLVSDWRVTWFILASAGISAGIALGYLAERPTLRSRTAYLRRLGAGAAASRRGVGIGVAGAAPADTGAQHGASKNEVWRLLHELRALSPGPAAHTRRHAGR